MHAMILPKPRVAAFLQKARVLMDVILHLGTHRTASTSFQRYMCENSSRLETAGLAFWGPRRTRKGLLSGVIPHPGPLSPADQYSRACGRIALNMQKAEAKGMTHLVVSDENIIGATRRNLKDNRLYGAIGERMARFAQAFDNKITRIALSVRSQDSYWASAIAFAVSRGHPIPAEGDLDRLVTTNRHWRQVITDIACAVPDTEILVQPYEVFGGRPEVKLSQMTSMTDVPKTHAREWVNRAPNLPQLRQILKERGENPAVLPDGDGRWQPFNRDQTAALREAYADDLFWLRAGAEGLATLTEETRPAKAGQEPQAGQTTRRGRPDGTQERRLA